MVWTKKEKQRKLTAKQEQEVKRLAKIVMKHMKPFLRRRTPQHIRKYLALCLLWNWQERL